MPVAGIARRYAQAAFAVAKEHRAVAEWQRALEAFREALAEAQTREFFESPAIPLDAKVQVLDRLFPTPEQRYVRNLLVLLLERGRLHQLDDIIAAFTDLALADQGIVQATITTAVDLGPNEQAQVQEQLEALLGHRLQITWRVDPAILGGVVIQVDDQVIDASIRTQLQQLHRQLVTAGGIRIAADGRSANAAEQP